MSYKAYLITFSVGTRVVSSKDLNQDENYDELWKLAGPRIHANLESGRLDNLDEINEDEECPFNPLTDREWMDDFVKFDEENKAEIGEYFGDIKKLFKGAHYRLRHACILSLVSLFGEYSDIRHEVDEGRMICIKIYQGLTMSLSDRLIAQFAISLGLDNSIENIDFRFM